MSITFEKPLDYPTALVTQRSRLPKLLYIVVDDVTFPTINSLDGVLTTSRIDSYFAKREFRWNDITKKRIETHLKYKTWEGKVSSFVSAYESETTALKFPPFSSSPTFKDHTHHITKLILDTEGLVPAWAATTAGRQIPIWIEQGALPKVPKGVLHMTPEGFDAFEATAWICLDEVRVVLELKQNVGERGEWLACGHIPKGRVCGQVVLHGVKTKERKKNNEEVEEVGNIRKREKAKEKRLVDEEVEEVDRSKKKEKGKETQKDPVQLNAYRPQIPVRTSSLSLRSYRSDDESVRSTGSMQEERPTTRESRDSNNERTVKIARSLLKKALLMSAKEVETERILQEIRDIQSHTCTELEMTEHQLKHQSSVAAQNTPQATQTETYADYDTPDDEVFNREPLAQPPPSPAHEQQRFAFQGSESPPKFSSPTRSNTVPSPRSSVGSIRDLAPADTTTNPPTPPPRNPARRRVAFALPKDPSPSRKPHRETHQHPTSPPSTPPKPPRTPLPNSPPPTPPLTPTLPASSISPRTLAWFDRIERNQDRGLVIQARLAQMAGWTQSVVVLPQSEERHATAREAGVDCSRWHIPEEVCSEEVLNERLNLPVATPRESWGSEGWEEEEDENEEGKEEEEREEEKNEEEEGKWW